MSRKRTLTRLVPCFLLPFLLTSCWEVDHGEKRGILVKLNSAGVIFKTREAELMRGGLANGSGTMGQSFHFSIDRPELFDLIQKAFNSNEEIVLNYHCELVVAPWRGETKCLLDGIDDD